jgi:CDP-diacylglycerol---serine O-phosphatidyltransferase
MLRHIPNFITSLNLAAGFISVIFAFKGDLAIASWFILAAMIFDFLDGFSARLLKAYSDIGKELDSLADVVSFGVAPAAILYMLINGSLQGSVQSFVQFITVIMPVCAALRLAKFNIDPTQTVSFKGLPTPASALAVVSVVVSQQYSESRLIDSFTGSTAALAIFLLILSLLMVSRIPLLSLKMTNLKLRGNEGRYILIASVILVLAVFGVAGATLIIPLYILVSFLSPLIGKPLVVNH